METKQKTNAKQFNNPIAKFLNARQTTNPSSLLKQL